MRISICYAALIIIILTNLLTSKRRRFCSCSGLSRNKVNISVIVCIRTYGRGSSDKVLTYSEYR